MRPQGDLGFGDISLDVTINADRGIKLCVDQDDTYDLEPGIYEFDVVATIDDEPRGVATGLIEVSSIDRITPLTGSTNMYINYKQRTDYRLTFTWNDTNGDVLAVDDAQLQAVDSNGTVVLDLDWYATPPDEGTIGGLPGQERGYLAPKSGASLELHISDQNTIAVGTYEFDLLVKSTTTQDWDKLANGTIEVERTITVVD